MFLLLKGAHYDLAIPKDTMTEKYASQQKKPKEKRPDENVVLKFPCNFCDRSFDSDGGRRIHMGRKHKEEISKQDVIHCELCDWSSCFKDDLTSHVQNKHIEQLKRKITKEQPSKCYICGFQSSSETAFQIHTEEKHNQEYSIQKATSVTKSPPNKKVKGHHEVDMDIEPLDIVKQKDDEIIALKSTINLLKQKLQDAEDTAANRVKPKEILESTNKIPDISEYPYTCETCKKGFTHKGNFQNHKRTHKETPRYMTAPKDKGQHEFNSNTDKTEELKKFQFSDINTCEKCGNVFKLKSKLDEHIGKYHKITTETPAPVVATIACNCKYPCIPNVVHEEIETDDQSQNEENKAITQIHCALNEATDCIFHCETKEQLKRHIEVEHRSNAHIQCTVCDLFFRNIEDLAQHMNKTHKKPDSAIKCNQCEKTLRDKQELKDHITTHKSYKPCKNYLTNTCSAVSCRFNHIKIPVDQEICFKCGLQFNSKTDLMNHIKTKHGSTLCHKFLHNKCQRSSEECIFSHYTTQTLSGEGPHLSKPQQDFPQIQATPLHSPQLRMPTMSQHIQSQHPFQGTQRMRPPLVDILEMLPQIIAQVVTALTTTITEHNRQI